MDEGSASPTTTPSLASGTDVRQEFGLPVIRHDELTLGRKLGSGRFGTVYAGTCRSLQVAIKVLFKRSLDEPSLAVFKAEVDVLSRCYHPNVCLFMGACFEPGHLMIVTELLPRGTLHDVLRSKADVPMFRRLRMARDIALGMTWLHNGDHVFIHRDLKAENILVDENWRCKVADFGLTVNMSPGEWRQDKEGKARGTPLYMAPEVLSGHPFNEKCDVYSYALVLWECITRRRVFERFERASFVVFKQAVVEARYRPVVPSHCPSSLATLLKACWAADGMKRPSFDAILVDLDEVLLDVTFPDPDARRFWRQAAGTDVSLPWKAFARALDTFVRFECPTFVPLPERPTPENFRSATLDQLDHLEQYNPSLRYASEAERLRRQALPSSEDDGHDPAAVHRRLRRLAMRCLRTLLAGPAGKASDVQSVTCDAFGRLLHWLGPIFTQPTTKPSSPEVAPSLRPNSLSSLVQALSTTAEASGAVGMDASESRLGPEASEVHFLDRLRCLAACPWFHGELSSLDAEQHLQGRSPGTFLIRFSGSSPGVFALSRVSTESSGRVLHQRIEHQYGSPFHVAGKSFAELRDLVQYCQPAMGLVAACPGSSLHAIASGALKGKYVESSSGGGGGGGGGGGAADVV